MTQDMQLTKNEFYAYLLTYAVQADFHVSEDEKEFILSRIPEDLYNKVSRILDKDSDYEAIQRIVANVRAHNYDYENPEAVIRDIKEAMRSDGDMDATELAAFVGLRRLLRNAAQQD